MKRCQATCVLLSILIVCGSSTCSLAEAIFLDDFADGDARDGEPVWWSSDALVESEDLVVRAASDVVRYTAVSQLANGESPMLDNTSIRTQFRLSRGGSAGVLIRLDESNWSIPNGFFGLMWDDMLEIGISGGDGQSRGSRMTNLHATQEDVVMQMDTIGNEISLRVWRPSEDMPAKPLLSIKNDMIHSGTVGVVAVSERYPSAGPVGAVFRYVQVADWPIGTPEPIPGDFNYDGVLDAADIDLLSAAVRTASSDPLLDINNDDQVDQDDRVMWVEQLRRTWFGDADLNGQFNSADFVQVFEMGEYETDDNSSWVEGDWNGDGRFTSDDFVVAFQDGGYEQGPRTDVAAVPEPGGWLLLILGLAGVMRRRGAA